MIAFSCSRCGQTLKVHDQFAGRQSKCPSCKQPLVVPPPAGTVSFVPPQQIDGTESCLAKVGLDAGITLSPHDTSKVEPATGNPAPRDPLPRRKAGKERYVIEGEIARGGMGAVLRALDCDIRREVAVKYMLDAHDPRKQARFIEEAQINGQLEHPNIVPVYDLGIDAQKRPFIMMKMIKGRSLKDALDQLRAQPKQAEKEWSLGRLLNILVSVCNALAFAHSRGVIHRDLKPANIMLGDFGEVYVMDWGLAKVLGRDGHEPAPAPDKPTSKVITSREPEGDQTQEGSVLGTPVYMPPEQAAGQITAIDQRSDVYSLGAILYEILTLQPPVVMEGGQLGVLMQVVQGEIILPEKRDPARTKAGKVPRELSAIAMKALAKEREQRYPTVEALRQDIERFQEGRSVSAKEDTKGELIWKFIKRNKGFSAGIAAAVLILLVSLYFLGIAYWDVSKAKDSMEQANKARDDQLHESLPVIYDAAKLSVQQRQFDAALKQVDLVLMYKPEHAAARLLRAQLLMGRKELDSAAKELERYLKLNPGDGDSRQLLDLCQRGQSRQANWGELSVILQRQKVPSLAERLAQNNKDLFELYTKRLNEVWPKGCELVLEQDGRLHLVIRDRSIRDLSPLQGMALSRLTIPSLPVSDLSPLQGMPLTFLNLTECTNITDISPLKGMPLTWLSLGRYVLPGPRVHDLTPLEGMKLEILRVPDRVDKGMTVIRQMSSLKNIGFHIDEGMSADEFWRNYDAGKYPSLKP